MYDGKILIGDEMIETQLIEKSNKLNISLDELIERYIRRGLFIDDFYDPPKRTKEELLQMSKRTVERDKKKGIPPIKHNFKSFVNRWENSDVYD